MEGALLVGGMLETKPARPLSAPPGGSSLGTYPWDKALHGGVPVSVRRATSVYWKSVPSLLHLGLQG